MTTCSVPGCLETASRRNRQWCERHYGRWRRHGDPLTGRAPDGSAIRFLEDVALPYEGDACLLWPYSKNHKGYARIHMDGRQVTATRVICERLYGPAPASNYQAAHSCGNGHLGCVSPRHLSWKTQTENAADKLTHGTARRGQDHPKAKLNEDDIRAIRAAPSSDGLAEQYGVAKVTIRHIRSGSGWSHV